MVRTPEEIRQLLFKSYIDLRRRTEENRDKMSKLIETMDPGDESYPGAKRLHRQLSNSVGILDTAIDELASHEDSTSDD
jgi:hypothetical protein